MHLQTNVAYIRKIKGLSYREFGEAVGGTEGKMKSYELAGIEPPLALLSTIADFAGVSLDTLVRRELNDETYGRLLNPIPTTPVLERWQTEVDQINKRLVRLEKQRSGLRKVG